MGGYSAAYTALAHSVNMFAPRRGKLVDYALIGTALVAWAVDVAAERYAARPMPESDVHDRVIELYKQRAEEWATQRGPGVTVNVINQASAASIPSRYMMEEGNPDINTDCFSCASAHLAATKAALERARAAARDGECGADCRKWLNMAADESAALLSWDWTDERISRLPEHQRRVIQPRKAEVEKLFGDLLAGDTQAVEINKAKSLLGESIRFTNSGDGTDHPEVAGRLKRSEEMLAAAERLDVTAFDVETANRLRRVRQAVGNKVDSPDALKDTWRQAREVAQSVNDRVFSSIDPAVLDDLSRRADAVWNGFKEGRTKAGDLH